MALPPPTTTTTSQKGLRRRSAAIEFLSNISFSSPLHVNVRDDHDTHSKQNNGTADGSKHESKSSGSSPPSSIHSSLSSLNDEFHEKADLKRSSESVAPLQYPAPNPLATPKVSLSRAWIVMANATPLSLVSCLAYNEEKRRMKHEKKVSSQTYLEKWALFDKRKRKSESYAHLLRNIAFAGSGYNPNYLDDPNLKTGKHKTVISLPCLMGSILQYTRPSDLKKELNERFKEMHPEVDGSLTLSQIRNLKVKLTNVSMAMDMEIATIALAFVYFEKLVLKRIVEKPNRRFVGGICLLLACKVNEPKGFPFQRFFHTLAKELEVSPKDVRDYEFYIFSQLEFHLYLPLHEISSHFERIFATLDYHNVQDYLGDNHFFLQT